MGGGLKPRGGKKPFVGGGPAIYGAKQHNPTPGAMIYNTTGKGINTPPRGVMGERTHPRGGDKN